MLAENPSREREDWSILEAYAGRTTIGFQRQVLRIARRDDLGASQKRELRRRNLEGMLVQGLALGAGYFELGARDVRDFPDVVRDFAPTLER